MKKITIILLLLVASKYVQSQEDSTKLDISDSIANLNVQKALSKQLYSPKQGTLLSSFSNVNITSEFGDNSASATAAFNVGASSVFSFYFKQPFEDKPKKVTFFDQDGMSAGTSAEIAFQHVFWKTKIDNAMFEDMKKAYAKTHNISKKSPEFRGITTGDFEDEDQVRFWSAKGNKLGTPLLIGFGYSVSKNDIDFVADSFSIAPVTENRTNHNLRFTIGIYARNRSVVSLSIVQEIKYESGDPLARIFPLGASGLSYTKDVTVGAPVKKNLTRLQFDYRQSFYKNGEIVFAIAPSFAYRTIQKSFVVEVPLYFLNLKDENKKVKGLQGGVTIGYTNKLKEKTSFNDGIAFGIFVAAPFDLFGYFKTK
jgi:hypothetical protein